MTIAPRYVDVWLVNGFEISDASKYAGILSVDEQRWASLLQHAQDRQRYIASHYSLHIILSYYLNVNPRILQFAVNEYGKPALVNNSEGPTIHFNLSHSAGWALIAIDRLGPVGIDIEFSRPLKVLGSVPHLT